MLGSPTLFALPGGQGVSPTPATFSLFMAAPHSGVARACDVLVSFLCRTHANHCTIQC